VSDTPDLNIYIEPTYFIDSDSPTIIEYASGICRGIYSDIDRAIALYYGVRDDIRYDPYSMEDKREAVRASSVLKMIHSFMNLIQRATAIWNMLMITAHLATYPMTLYMGR